VQENHRDSSGRAALVAGLESRRDPELQHPVDLGLVSDTQVRPEFSTGNRGTFEVTRHRDVDR
jgi:hypothetical protein